MAVFFSSLALGFGQMFQGAVLRLLLKSAALTLLIFAVLAGVGWYAADWLLTLAGLGEDLFTGASTLRGVASALLAVLGAWLLWRIVAMAVIQFYADDIVLAVERRHYPEAAAQARDLAVPAQLRQALRGAGRALLANLIVAPFALALAFTGIGTALLFWAVNAWLLGRELQDIVWLRHAHATGERAPVGAVSRLALGGFIAALMVVPFVQFLAPVLGAASATHLVHRAQSARGHKGFR
ncbi:EI24 domain-containing protein [Aurantiacibacter suaedae]|uniref:EI24 domain-containing protein n=1 Tax=Aurantiacibacter suaedae TaxID=2545755 RepID=UPI0010F90D79|nr:EI24 domain-containing protein [Aurantiacibacter suaedae]